MIYHIFQPQTHIEMQRKSPLQHIHTALYVFMWSTLGCGASGALCFWSMTQRNSRSSPKMLNVHCERAGRLQSMAKGTELHTSGPLHQRDRGPKLENLGVMWGKSWRMRWEWWKEARNDETGMDKREKSLLIIHVSWCKLWTEFIFNVI